MYHLKKIYSERKMESYPAYQIVYEWEDVLLSQLQLKLSCRTELIRKFNRRFEKNGLVELYQHMLPKRSNLRLYFAMAAMLKKKCTINKNTIPVIIDFWLDEEDIPTFIDAYKHVPLLLVTNREVYELLRKFDLPFPIEHWALSYPDKYKIDESATYEKPFEFTIIGRPNPFFLRLLDKYCSSHPDFTYLQNNGDINNRLYINHRGEVVADGNSRESYLDVIRKTKISCYTTPGLDEAKKDSNKYNQVTPRLFELLCNGCQVIGHYPNTADTVWYRLNEVVPNVNTYEEFESVLDRLRVEIADIHKVSDYMSQHYTSVRAEQLVGILAKHNIFIG